MKKVKAELTAAPSKGTYLLRLYVAGATTRSREAIRRVYQICENELENRYRLEVIDVYQQPLLAIKNQIIGTPTLVKESPLPARRYVGSLAGATNLFGERGVA